MVDGAVDEIISAQARAELAATTEELKAANAELLKMAANSKAITFDFSKVKSISDLNDLLAKNKVLTDEVAAATDRVSKAKEAQTEKALRNLEIVGAREARDLQRYVENEEKKVQAKQAAEDKKILADLAAEDKRNAIRTRQAQKDEDALNRMIRAEEDADKKKQLIVERDEKRREIAAARAGTAADAAAQRMDALAERRRIAVEKQETREILAINAAIEREGRLAAAVQTAADKIAAARQRELDKLKESERAYNVLQSNYSRAQQAAKDLSAEYYLMSAEFERNNQRRMFASEQEKRIWEQSRASAATTLEDLRRRMNTAAAGALELNQSLQRIDRTVGQSQRNVGNYNSAAFALSQILREGPAFAYSFATGLLGISNNIPILVDQIQMLKVKNEELVASGGKAVPIWRTLSSAIFSTNGMITIATTVATIFFARMSMNNNKIKESTDTVKKYEEALRSLAEVFSNINANISVGITSELDKVQMLMGAYNDVRTTQQGRVNAYKQLQSIYPSILSDMTDEEKATGKINAEHERQIANLKDIVKAKVNVSEIDKAISAERRLQAQAEKEMNDLALKFSPSSQRGLQRALAAQGNNSQHVNFTDPAEGVDETAINKYLTYRDRLLRSEKEITNLKGLQQKYNIEYLNAQKEIDKTGGNGLTGSSASLDGEKNLLQAQAAQRAQYLATVREQQQAIMSDEKKTIAEREIASSLYYAATVEQAATAYHEQLALQDENLKASYQKQADYQLKIDELRAGKGGLSASQRAKSIENAQAIIDDEFKNQDSFKVNKNTALDALNTATLKAQNDNTKSFIEINKSGNAEWIKDNQDAFAKAKLDEIVAYNVELELLEKSFADKKISRTQYDQQLRDLKKKENIIQLEAEVELDRRILENTNLTNEQRLQYEIDLGNKLEALGNARAAQTSPNKKQKGRSTDAIAMLFAPEVGSKDYDKDKELKYLQQFYDQTIELARNAAAAIMEIENRKFAAEQARLDEKANSIRNNAEDERNAITATADNEVDKANKLSKLNAQTQAQQAAIEQEKRQVAQEQAKFARTAAIAGIIANTAVAITKTLAELGVYGIPVAALIAATGAVQLSVASSAPIPAYKMGTTNHKGGKFIAGDGGEPELIVAPDKAPYWSNAISTMYNEKAGTKVIPLGKMDVMGGYVPGSYSRAEQQRQSELMILTLGAEFGAHLRQHGENLSHVIVSTRTKPVQPESMRDAVKSLKNMQGL